MLFGQVGDTLLKIQGYRNLCNVLINVRAKLEQPILFLGPPAVAMRALGDKIASTLIAQSANIPTLPWSGSDITVEPHQVTCIPPEIYKKACIDTIEKGLEVCLRIGFPVMIKASEGGGGKGIRKISKLQEFEDAFRQVQLEVPGSPIFVMKVASKARHLEVQIIGDLYGNSISLFGRDW